MDIQLVLLLLIIVAVAAKVADYVTTVEAIHDGAVEAWFVTRKFMEWFGTRGGVLFGDTLSFALIAVAVWLLYPSWWSTAPLGALALSDAVVAWNNVKHIDREN